MGKKLKVGKQRRDKYYFLSKEAGYRSRAAFKLIQLNKRFEFLENSRVLVDLCAAPGGWLQVAAQNMPVSSVRIGVDLVSIRPIKECITLQGDITQEKTRHAIKKELKNSDVDCVLHDGAPNVGTNWTHDAFSQNCLTLSALRLATQVLKRGGYFITKIFRSSDYLSLISVFEKLFKKVHVWKPAASRLESAEIFVVCERYEKPDKVDPELLDVKKVFEKQEGGQEDAVNPHRLLLLTKKKDKKAKALGYSEGDITQFHEIKASEFVSSSNPLLLLSQASCLIFDTDELIESKHTTQEIRECARDVKVCGPGEVKHLLAWRKKILANAAVEKKERQRAEKAAEEMEIDENEEETVEIRVLEELDEAIRNAQSDEKAKLKRRKRLLLKNLQKQREREKFEMTAADKEPLIAEDLEVFSLKRTKRLAAKLGAYVPSKVAHLSSDKSEDSERATLDVNTDVEMVEETDDLKEDEPEAKKRRKSIVKLTPEECALGELMIYSKKSANDLEDWAWNRYSSNDDNLPLWFVEDEKKHWRKEMPVEKTRVDYYKERDRDINTRTIKKVVEAKLRKKKKVARRMSRARKQADGVVENEGLEHGEKLKEIKKIYKKAALPKKKVQLQVVTKGKRGAMQRPKGPFKLVDRRLKKDNRSQKSKGSSSSNKGARKGGYAKDKRRARK